MTQNARYTFFFRTNSPFSQWFPCKFTVNGIEYNCAEQYMMYMKALLFNDEKSAAMILSANHPRIQKELGRLIKDFKTEAWHKDASKIVYMGNYHKFTQNDDLKAILLDTGNTILVEASPTDTFWGIGLSETDPDRFDEKKWKGRNLLGIVLTKLREDLRNEIDTQL